MAAKGQEASYWSCIRNVEDDDSWWQSAYQYFLEIDPIAMILHHADVYKSGDNWDDYHFRRVTPVPTKGAINDVSKRAVLVAIARSRKMRGNDWDNLPPPPSTPAPDLQKTEKELINCVMDLIYDQDGNPRPFIK